MTLLRQVTDGLLGQQRDTALAETTSGIRIAQNLLDAADEAGSTASNLLTRQIVRDLTFRGGAEGDANRPRSCSSATTRRPTRGTSNRAVFPSSCATRPWTRARCSGPTR